MPEARDAKPEEEEEEFTQELPVFAYWRSDSPARLTDTPPQAAGGVASRHRGVHDPRKTHHTLPCKNLFTRGSCQGVTHSRYWIGTRGRGGGDHLKPCLRLCYACASLYTPYAYAYTVLVLTLSADILYYLCLISNHIS